MRTITTNLVMTNITGITIDTYQMFNGDFAIEYEIESIRDRYDLDTDALDTWQDIEIDHPAVVRDLAEKNLKIVIRNLESDSGEKIILSGEVTETWSPREYNFSTDGYETEVTIDLDALESATPDFDLRTFVSKVWGNRPGFISYIPSKCEDADWNTESDIGLTMRLDYLMRMDSMQATIDEITNDMFESENEIYSEHLDITGETAKIINQLEAVTDRMEMAEMAYKDQNIL